MGSRVKFTDFLGGLPYKNQILNFLQTALRDAIKGVGSFIGSNALLSGCVPASVGGGLYTFSSGYVMINGEVLFVPAVTTPIVFDEDNNYFVLTVGEDPTGLVKFWNGTQNNVFETRVAVLIYDNSSTPANSIGWLTAYNNRFDKRTFDAVMAQTILPQKGMFWKRLAATLSVVGNAIDFDSANGNAARVTTSNSIIETINLSLSGGGQPFMFTLKVLGTGTLRIKHGNIICPDGRDHDFNVDDIIVLYNDGGSPTSVTHLISIGVGVKSTFVSSFGAGVTAYLAPVLYGRTIFREVFMQGRADVAAGFDNDIICQLPIGYRPQMEVSFIGHHYAGNGFVKLIVRTDGFIQAYAGDGGSLVGSQISLDSIRFFN